MKQKLTAAFIAATCIVLISCDWFHSKKHQNANPLIGHWKLDSIRGKDSTLAFMLSLQVLKDSAGTELDFKKDTVVTITGHVRDTTLYSWNEKEKQFIPADTPKRIFQFASLNDSSVTLTSGDSTVYFLLKK